MKSKLLEHNIKGNGHDKPAKYDPEKVPRNFFGDTGTYQNAHHGAQRKPE